MAVWVCTQCGFEKEARCKPKKCPECGAGAFDKKGQSEEATAAAPARRTGPRAAASKKR